MRRIAIVMLLGIFEIQTPPLSKKIPFIAVQTTRRKENDLDGVQISVLARMLKPGGQQTASGGDFFGFGDGPAANC